MAPPFDYHIPSRALLQVQQSFIASSTALGMPFRPRNRRERMEAIGLLPDGKLNHMEYYELEQRKDKNFLRILSMLLRPDLQSFQLLGIPNLSFCGKPRTQPQLRHSKAALQGQHRGWGGGIRKSCERPGPSAARVSRERDPSTGCAAIPPRTAR